MYIWHFTDQLLYTRELCTRLAPCCGLLWFIHTIDVTSTGSEPIKRAWINNSHKFTMNLLWAITNTNNVCDIYQFPMVLTGIFTHFAMCSVILCFKEKLILSIVTIVATKTHISWQWFLMGISPWHRVMQRAWQDTPRTKAVVPVT